MVRECEHAARYHRERLALADLWRLAETVNLRPEAFGGMAFHCERGITVEVDDEAYRFLCAYLEPHPLPAPGDSAAHLVPQLVRMGFLCDFDIPRI